VQDKDILASQQEYRKGVSSWNFDVAALKAAAAAAREDDDGAERLPPISEASGGLLGLACWGAVWRGAGQVGGLRWDARSGGLVTWLRNPRHGRCCQLLIRIGSCSSPAQRWAS
jgi:hypothetical protein